MKRALVVLSAFSLVMAFLPSFIQAQYPYWRYDRLIEGNTGHQASSPRVAVSGTNAVAVWCQEYDGTFRVYSNYSTNGGATWHNAKIIEDNVGCVASGVQVALSGSKAVAVWTQTIGSYYQVHANYSTDGGATWHTDQKIDYPAGSHSMGVQVAVSGTRVAVVWFHEYLGALHVYFNSSQDAGKTWRNYPLQIETTTDYESQYPHVALSGAHIAVVWTRTDGSNKRVFYNASADGGITWHGYDILDDNAGYDVYAPKVAVSGTNAVAVWEQMSSTGNWRIYSSYSTDGGATWQADKLVADLGTANQNKPQVVISRTRVVAVWRQANLGGAALIYSCFSPDGGANWSTAQPIETSNGFSADNPQLALTGNGVVAVWGQSDGNMSRIFANYSPDKGAHWRSERMIDGLAGTSGVEPQVALSGSAIVAAWRVQDGSNSRVAANNAIYSTGQKDKLKPPLLTSPPSGATDLTTDVAFKWKDTNSLPQELKLKIRLKPAGGLYKYFTVPADYTSYVISGLLRGKTYSWNVQAVGNGTKILNSTWANGGTDWKFATAI